jgi:glycosyltransferase involved in cell wall biosynthesis
MSVAALPTLDHSLVLSTGAPRRVAICAGYSPSLLNFRGPLLRELVVGGHEVIACGPQATPDLREALSELGVTFREVPCDRAGLSVRRDLRLLRALVSLFRSVEPDIVLNYTIKPVIYGSLAARLAGVPHVYSMITGVGYAFTGEGIGRRAVRMAASALLRLSLRGNRAVFFQNPDDRALFEQLGLIGQRGRSILINGSGVDIEEYRPAPLPDQLSFLMIARLLADKGVREYVAAARLIRARYPDVRFRLVGPLDPNPSALRREEIQKWVREGLIDYLGELEDVRPAIAASSVYVLPSYREGTPRTVLEAMAMGRPAVTTDAPGCRETVVHGVNGYLVPVRDAEALAQALERFIQEPELVGQMGGESRRIVADKYDVHKVNRVILETMRLAR